MADFCVGDVVNSALDRAYQQYSVWCNQLGYHPADFEAWLRMERYGVGNRTMAGLGSYSESRARLARMRAAQASRLTTA